MQKMKVSIITAVYNGEETIQSAIDSVANQSYQDIEYIVIDGSSNDGTINILERNKKNIDTLISEEDGGIYHAMNKGVKLATGDIIGILNADDFYQDGTVVSEVVKQIEISNSEGVYGDLIYIDKKDMSKVVRYWRAGKYTHEDFLWGWMPPHPTVFLKKSIYERFGLFNTDFISAADYEFLLRIMYKHKIHLEYIPRVITRMRLGGKSNVTLENRLRANKEDFKAWKVNDLNPYFFTTFLKPIKKLKQFWERPTS